MKLNNLKTLTLLSIVALCTTLLSCGGDCYETAEPQVFLKFRNNCQYQAVDADGIKEPIEIDNDCDSNFGMATITLPLLETRKTYFFTDGFNRIDSITLTYNLTESFQNDCGYVVMLNHLSFDSTASSLPLFHEFSYTPNDTVNTHITYSTFADYIRNYY